MAKTKKLEHIKIKGGDYPTNMHYCHYEERWRPTKDFRYYMNTSQDRSRARFIYVTKQITTMAGRIPRPSAICEECRHQKRSLIKRYKHLKYNHIDL